jgi:hypothetical protein
MAPSLIDFNAVGDTMDLADSVFTISIHTLAPAILDFKLLNMDSMIYNVCNYTIIMTSGGFVLVWLVPMQFHEVVPVRSFN